MTAWLRRRWWRKRSRLERAPPATLGCSREIATVLPDHDALYDAAIAAVRGSDAEGRARRLDIASLHGHAEHRAQRQSARSLDLREAMLGRVAQGWKLRRLVTVTTHDRLDREKATLDYLDGLPDVRVEVRALVTDSVPVMAPLIVAGEVAILGCEDERDFGASEGFAFSAPQSVELIQSYFDLLWRDNRGIVLRTQAGTRVEGLATVRAEVESFQLYQVERRDRESHGDGLSWGSVLAALDDPRLARAPRVEFQEARRGLRASTPEGRKRAVADACNAVESGMKVLIAEHGLPLPPKQNAQVLFQSLRDNRLLSQDEEAIVLGAARFGNARGRHGAGALPHDVTAGEARAVLASAAAALTLLAARLP